MSNEATPSDGSKDVSNLTTCQNCGKEDPNLTAVDAGLRLSLQKSGQEGVPNFVCATCMKSLKKSASLGAQELAKQELKASEASALWKTRLGLVKQGHRLLQIGDYSQAAQAYEKYLKVLQIVVKAPSRKTLDPKHFNDHPKEITIICSVLWDLLLIYDSNPKFYPKQMESLEILSRFVRFSPVYNTIIRKAEKEARKAKNPQAFKTFLKLCDAHASRCFIANEAFGSRVDPTVVTLCEFRDQVLKKSSLGRSWVAFYYKNSPRWAAVLRQYPMAGRCLRPLLTALASLIKKFFHLK